MRANALLVISLLALILPIALSHLGEEEVAEEHSLFEILGGSPYFILGVIALAAIVAAALFTMKGKKKITQNDKKKIIFRSFVILVVSITIAISGTVIYNNFTSWSRGPVHWHADFTIVLCGESIALPEPESIFTNKVGTEESHHHSDMRIHIEGVIMEREQATLGFFLKAIGGELTENSITVPTDEGMVVYKSGDVCPNTGNSGLLTVYVNDRPIENAPEYIISPFQDVPPGDSIRFVFE